MQSTLPQNRNIAIEALTNLENQFSRKSEAFHSKVMHGTRVVMVDTLA